jgi:metallo-beta-lactamase family protein
LCGYFVKKSDPLHPIQNIDKKAHYLVCESTYGNKKHNEISPEIELESYIKATCINKKGKLIIPAFSIGRAQQILYTLHKLYVKNKLYQLPVLIDSNSAYQASRVYEKFSDWLKPSILDFKKEYEQITHFDSIIYLKTALQFNKIKTFNNPSIILTSSGMMVGGRVLKHIGLHLQNNANTLLLVGYTAPGTLAHQLILDKSSVEINKEKNKIKADIYKTDVFSAHADQNELMDFIKQFDRTMLKNIFLTHGTTQTKSILKEKINALSEQIVTIPTYKESIEL